MSDLKLAEPMEIRAELESDAGETTEQILEKQIAELGGELVIPVVQLPQQQQNIDPPEAA